MSQLILFKGQEFFGFRNFLGFKKILGWEIFRIKKFSGLKKFFGLEIFKVKNFSGLHLLSTYLSINWPPRVFGTIGLRFDPNVSHFFNLLYAFKINVWSRQEIFLSILVGGKIKSRSKQFGFDLNRNQNFRPAVNHFELKILPLE